MVMPEATIYKDNYLMLWQNDVGSTWQFSIVYSVAETFGKKSFPDGDFISRVPAFHGRHHTASGLFVNNIHLIPRTLPDSKANPSLPIRPNHPSSPSSSRNSEDRGCYSLLQLQAAYPNSYSTISLLYRDDPSCRITHYLPIPALPVFILQQQFYLPVKIRYIFAILFFSVIIIVLQSQLFRNFMTD
jgi:hypothetical protein